MPRSFLPPASAVEVRVPNQAGILDTTKKLQWNALDVKWIAPEAGFESLHEIR